MSNTIEQLHGTPEMPQFVYELDDIARPQLAQSLVAEARAAGTLPQEDIVCFRVPGDDVHSNLGRELETNVFDQKFGNTPDVMQAEYGRYDPRSRFYVVVDTAIEDAPETVGVLRIIKSNPDNTETGGLKSLDDIEPHDLPVDLADMKREHTIDTSNSIDVATTAVKPEYRAHAKRAGRVALILNRAMYADAYEEGVDSMVAIIDKGARTGLQIVLGSTALHAVTESFPYLDSKDSQMMHAKIAGMDGQVRRNEISHAGKAMKHALKSAGSAVIGNLVKARQQWRQAQRHATYAVAAHGLRTGLLLDKHMAFSYKK